MVQKKKKQKKTPAVIDVKSNYRDQNYFLYQGVSVCILGQASALFWSQHLMELQQNQLLVGAESGVLTQRGTIKSQDEEAILSETYFVVSGNSVSVAGHESSNRIMIQTIWQ